MTGLTVKTLRFYHDERLLIPTHVDPAAGYRYYESTQIERARSIAFLRSLDLSIADIRTLLERENSGDFLDILERHRSELAAKIKHLRNAEKVLANYISQEQKERTVTAASHAVEEKEMPPATIAAIRMKGAYSDCGKAFGLIARAFGRDLTGKPMMLHHDAEYKEQDADFEACFPVRKAKAVDGIAVRELPAARCVTLVHRGPYDELGRSYEKVLSYIKSRHLEVEMPTREVYLKGPGMIFRGSPKNYLTEIQIPIHAMK